MPYPICRNPCCNNGPDDYRSGLDIRVGSQYRLGSCNFCHPRDLDDLFSQRWEQREVLEIRPMRGNGLIVRLCRAHIQRIHTHSKLGNPRIP